MGGYSIEIISIPLHTGSFRNLVDITFVCAMGPPGGGRNPITPRLARHFNYLSFTELEDSSKFKLGKRERERKWRGWCGVGNEEPGAQE